MNESFRARRKELVNYVKMVAHARGLVFVPFSHVDCCAVVGKTAAQLSAATATAPPGKPRARALFRQRVKAQLEALQGDPGQGAFCGTTMPADFKQTLLLGKAPAIGERPKDALWRTDTAMVLAYQMSTNSSQMVLVGVVSYGASDYDEVTQHGTHQSQAAAPLRARVNAALKSIRDNDDALELDMVCTRGATRSTGALLTAFVLAKELARSRARAPRFRTVITKLAYAGAGSGAAVGTMPFWGVATLLGFEDARLPVPDDADGEYFVLLGTPAAGGEDVCATLLSHMRVAFPLGPLSDVCPMKTGTGLTQCL